jgi:molybdopterin converting factor small subunit
MLNEKLAKEQKITQKQKDNLEELYKQMFELFERAEKELDNNTLTLENGRVYDEQIKNLEFQMQDNWNFEKDPLKHTWWNRAPGCLCPQFDNAERFGFDKIHRQDCPYHGWEEEN